MSLQMTELGFARSAKRIIGLKGLCGVRYVSVLYQARQELKMNIAH